MSLIARDQFQNVADTLCRCTINLVAADDGYHSCRFCRCERRSRSGYRHLVETDGSTLQRVVGQFRTHTNAVGLGVLQRTDAEHSDNNHLAQTREESIALVRKMREAQRRYRVETLLFHLVDNNYFVENDCEVT